MIQESIRQHNRNLNSSPDPVRRAKRRMYLFGGRRSCHLGTVVASVLATLHVAFILFCVGFAGFLYPFSHTASHTCLPFLSIGGLLYCLGTVDHSANTWSPFATPPARLIAWFMLHLRHKISGPACQVDPEGGEVAASVDPEGWMIAEGMNWLINQSLSWHDIDKVETFLDGIPGFIANHWERSGWKNVSHVNREKLLDTIFYLVTTCTSTPPISIEIRRPRVVVTLRALIYLMVFDQKGRLLNNIPEEQSKGLKCLARDGDSVILAWANCALAFVMRRVLHKDSNRIGFSQGLPLDFFIEVDCMLEKMEKERRLVERGLDKGNDKGDLSSENHGSILELSSESAHRPGAMESAKDSNLIRSIQAAIITCRTNCGFVQKFDKDLIDYQSGFPFTDPLLPLLEALNLLLEMTMVHKLLNSHVLCLQGNLRGIHLLPKLPEDLDFPSVLYNNPYDHIDMSVESPAAARELLPFLQRITQDQNCNMDEPWRQDAIKQRERNYNNRLKVNPFMYSIPELIRRPCQSSAWLLSDLAEQKVAIQMHWIVLSLKWGPANAIKSFDDKKAFGEPLEYLGKVLIQDFQEPSQSGTGSAAGSKLDTKKALSRLLCLVITQAIDPASASPHKIPTLVIEFLVKVIEGVLNLPSDNQESQDASGSKLGSPRQREKV